MKYFNKFHTLRGLETPESNAILISFLIVLFNQKSFELINRNA